MKWEKIGLIFDLTKGKPSWLKSHAMMPLALELDDRIRIYYTGRHIDGRSRISFFDVDKDNPLNVLYVHDLPLLEVGAIGTFDDCGTVATCVLSHNNMIYLYYNGYNVRNTVPWSNSIGLAISTDGGRTFVKKFPGPVMDRSISDPYFTITPCIIIEDGKWHMWYTSGTGWIPIDKRVEPVYNIKYASSTDGVIWILKNEIAIRQGNPEECVARATILKDFNKLKMWFIYRGSRDFRDGVDSYRIGYAEGDIANPTEWIRDDSKAGIRPGPELYDDKMQAYANVVRIGDKFYMFYNGNNFGQEGVACATGSVEI
ncbi:glycosylase [soil metagenome]